MANTRSNTDTIPTSNKADTHHHKAHILSKAEYVCYPENRQLANDSADTRVDAICAARRQLPGPTPEEG